MTIDMTSNTLISTKRFSELLKVEVATVGKWRLKGMPYRKKKSQGQGHRSSEIYHRPKQCLEWLKQNAHMWGPANKSKVTWGDKGKVSYEEIADKAGVEVPLVLCVLFCNGSYSYEVFVKVKTVAAELGLRTSHLSYASYSTGLRPYKEVQDEEPVFNKNNPHFIKWSKGYLRDHLPPLLSAAGYSCSETQVYNNMPDIEIALKAGSITDTCWMSWLMVKQILISKYGVV